MIAAGRVLTLQSPAPDVTRAVAGVVARHLEPGDVVALTGELGAGKTCFVQGAAHALGVRERVTSPTFLLRRDYEGTLGVTHLDVYRMETLADVRTLGHDDAEQRDRVTFIEWADAVRPLLPADHLEVELRLPPPDVAAPPSPDAALAEPRTVVLHAHGPRWLRRADALHRDCAQWATS